MGLRTATTGVCDICDKFFESLGSRIPQGMDCYYLCKRHRNDDRIIITQDFYICDECSGVQDGSATTVFRKQKSLFKWLFHKRGKLNEKT